MSITCGTSHCRFSSVIERWTSTRPRTSEKRGDPNGVRQAAQVGAATLWRALARSSSASTASALAPVARRRAVPWQSAQRDLDGVARLAVQLAVAVVVLLEMAIDALHAALEMNVLEVHRLAGALGGALGGASRGRSAGARRSVKLTASASAALEASLTGLPCASSRLPLRSRLNTARNSQPWPWKSANCVCFSCALNSGVPVRCRNSRIRPQAAQRAAFRVALLDLGALARSTACGRPADTSCRRRSRCPTTSAPDRSPPCWCRGACGTSCTGWSESTSSCTCLIGWPDSLLRDHLVGRLRSCP